MMAARRFLSWLHKADHGESGQMVIMVALLMTLILSFAALAIDIGLATHERRNLQNAADAMALAGGSQIKADGSGDGAATSVATTWGTENGVDAAEIEAITFDKTCANESVPNTISVRLHRDSKTFLARVLGKDFIPVEVCATAARYSAAGSVGMAPFGVDDNCVHGQDGIPNTNDTWEKHAGDTITIKYDSNNEGGAVCDASSGNFWLLAIDDTGAGEPCGSPVPAGDEERKLREAICFGAITPLCTPDALAEGEDCDTDVDTQTGNVASIKDSLKYVLDNVPPECNTMAEIVGSTAPYALTDDCNPFLPGYESDVSLVKLIPVLDKLSGANGKSNIDIVDFLIVVIDPAQIVSGWCSGGCEIQAKIMGTMVNPKSLRKALDDSSSNNFTVLIK